MRRNIRLLLILLMLAALVLAACGGGDDEDETETPPTEDTTAQVTEVEETEEATEEPVVEATEEPEAVNIVETASAGDFTTLVAAVEAAGLTETFSAEGPYTVFAPTDAALEGVDLTADVLLYHVVAGEYTAEQLLGMDGETLTTLAGGELTISVDGETVMVNTATVTVTDVLASNGIIHVIDAALAPMAAVEATEEPVVEATEEPAVEATEEPMVEATEEPMAMTNVVTNVCLVTDQGGINDGNFNALANDGMQRAANDYGLETTVIESGTPSDFAPNIQTCIDSGFDVIVTVGFLMTDTSLEFATANPDLYFIGVDQFFDGQPANLVGIQYREDQAGFLVGVMAARMTQSNIIGGVYGIDVPAVVKFRNGFEQGAKFINPEITVLGQYTDSFNNSALGAQIAEQFIGEGADVIFGAGGGTGTGGIQFAAAEGVLVIGVDQDEYFTNFGAGESPGAENLISSALKAVDVGVYDMLAALSGDEGFSWMGGGLYILEAANDGIGFAPAHDASVPQEVTDEVQSVYEMLKSGELETGVDGLTGALLGDEAVEEPAVEATEEPAVEATEEPVVEATEEPAVEATEEPAVEATEEPAAAAGVTIAEIALGDANFSTLVMLATAPGVDSAIVEQLLNPEASLTVFAPTNEAFDSLLTSLNIDPAKLAEQPELINTILMYHVAEGAVTSDQLSNGQEIPTLLEGESIAVQVAGDVVKLDYTATVVTPDVAASNGVVHVINEVLLPQTAVRMYNSMRAELAPPPPPEEGEGEEAAAETTEEPGTIADIVANTEGFTNLLTALEAAGQVELLSGEGSFTVFAPNDDAFAKLPEGVFESLLSSPISVQSVLAYHMLDGAVMAADIADGAMIPSLLGAPLTFAVGEDGTVTVNGEVVVVTADIVASNGVIHVIDTVLIPASPHGAMGPGSEATEEPAVEATEEPMVMTSVVTNVCLVTDQGGINDGNFNALANDGMQRAANDYGLETTVIESGTPSDFAPNIQTCIDSGFDVIVTVGFLMTDTSLEFATANPDLYFIGVDQFFDGQPANLVGIQYREDQAGFLVGVMAARMTQSNIIGGVYGIDVPAVVKFRNGFEQGAKFINPEITVLGQYTDSFNNSALGAQIAEQFIGEGADVIFGAGGGTGTGGIQFAAAEGVLVIGVDQDEYFTNFGAGESPGAENLISSALKAVDVGVYDMLAALSGDEGFSWMGGGLYILEAANDGIGFAPAHDASVPQEVTDEVQSVYEMLKSGELETGVDGLTGELLASE